MLLSFVPFNEVEEETKTFLSSDKNTPSIKVSRSVYLKTLYDLFFPFFLSFFFFLNKENSSSVSDL